MGAGAKGAYSVGGCLARAIDTGVANTGPTDHVLTMDGDGAQNPDQIPHMIEQFPFADIVIGSRFVHGSYHSGKGTLPYYTRRAFSLACQVRTGLPIKDFGGGFRLYRSGIAHNLFPTRSCGRAYLAEVLFNASRMNYEVKETPSSHVVTTTKLQRADVLEAAQLLARMRRVGGPKRMAGGPKEGGSAFSEG
jgi:dolichol-phosphate mannosyltransferase